VNYKALIGLSLLQETYFRARPGASLKDLNLNTTSTSKEKCFPSVDKIQGNTPTLVKHSSYEELD
jgi:hypothetical protein